ncbi:MAG: Na+/H+ antiporter subunit E [Actinomycetota bacterium]
MIALIRRVVWFVYLILYTLYGIVVANALVAWEVVTPTHYMRPGIIGIPLRCTSNAQVTLLAILISLTPGTLFLDLARDRETIYVHGLHVRTPEHFRQRIQKLEDLIMKATT